MHYIFKKLPENVNFLYGSIHAIRKEAVPHYSANIKIADDLALGQQLASSGKRIVFLKSLEVIHLKKYNIHIFIKNDFCVPFDWAKIFLTYNGWKQLGKNNTGFAHSPKEQLLSVFLAPIILLFAVMNLFYRPLGILILLLCLIWVSLNFYFLNFLRKEKGFSFAIISLFVTFFDNIIMATGILSGFCSVFTQKLKWKKT